jgi:hypothetical protein
MSKMKRAAMVGILFFVSAAAQAGQPYWSMPGAGCVPGDPAIQFDRYFITAGSVNYKTARSGLVTLYCPVNPNPVVLAITQTSTSTFPLGPNNAYLFRLTYTDSDGAAAAVSVTARLLRLAKSNGGFTGAVPGATLVSSASAVTTQTNLSGPFDHSFDFVSQYYYVRVDLNRAVGTSAIATFYGVAIECR